MKPRDAAILGGVLGGIAGYLRAKSSLEKYEETDEYWKQAAMSILPFAGAGAGIGFVVAKNAQPTAKFNTSGERSPLKNVEKIASALDPEAPTRADLMHAKGQVKGVVRWGEFKGDRHSVGGY